MHNAEVHSAAHAHKVPSVIRCWRTGIFRSRACAFAQEYLVAGPEYVQFCVRVFPSSELTLDHVVPRSRGGRSPGKTWWPVATAATITG